MRVLTMRRTLTAVLAALTALTVALATTAPWAAAAPAVRDQFLYSAAPNVQASTPLGLVVVDAYLSTSNGTIALYDDSRTELRAVTGGDFTVTVTDSAVTGSGSLFAPAGDVMGTAALDLAVTHTRTEVRRYRKSIGNHASIETDTITHYEVHGTVTLMGQTFLIHGIGQQVLYEFFWNAPASEVGRDAYGTLSATAGAPDGSTIALTADAGQFAAVVFDPLGDVRAFAVGQEGVDVLRSDGLHGIVDLFDLGGSAPVMREIDVAGSLGHDKVRTVEQRPKGEVHLTTRTLTLHGVLDLGPSLQFDLEGVQASWQEARWVYQRPRS